jgi:hypothetical protein
LPATGKAKDGDAFVTVPGTVFTVLLKAPPNADIATLLARVRPAK